MSIRIGINGFGRIGRQVAKIFFEKLNGNIEIVMINELSNTATMAHLLKYDSCYGKFQGQIEANEKFIVINGKKVICTAEKEPGKIPWGKYNVDIVIESTGRFNTREYAMEHINAGAKKVIFTAPSKGEDITIVMGVNEDQYEAQKHHIISNASCTTNCLAPFAKVLNDSFGIKKGLMTTIHSYTNDQTILDRSHQDLQRGRAGALSIIPSTTGAAKAVALVIPELKGKLTGMSFRVPTPTVSVVDLVVELQKNVMVEEINGVLKKEAEGRLKGILEYCDEPLVSIDFKGNPHSAIIDGPSTTVIDGNMAKIIGWYDNEWGYSNRVVDLISFIVKSL